MVNKICLHISHQNVIFYPCIFHSFGNFGFMLIHTYQIYMICKHILFVTFLNEPELTFFHTIKLFQVFLSNTNNSVYS